MCFSGQTVDFCLLYVFYIWKAMTLSYNLAYLETILVHPTRRQIFANTVQLNCTSDLTPCLYAQKIVMWVIGCLILKLIQNSSSEDLLPFFNN